MLQIETELNLTTQITKNDMPCNSIQNLPVSTSYSNSNTTLPEPTNLKKTYGKTSLFMKIDKYNI